MARSRTRIDYKKIGLEYVQSLVKRGASAADRTILSVATELAGHSGFPMFKKYELALRELAYKNQLVLGPEPFPGSNGVYGEVLSLPTTA